MKRTIFVTLLILILSMSIAGCSSDKTKDAVEQDFQTLTIGVLPDVDSIPFIIAKYNGYFEKEGLDVEIHHFKSAMDRDSALQTGSIDGAISDMPAIVFFKDNGFDVKITSKTDGSFKLIAGKSSNISNLEEIKGKTIGISKNTIIEYVTDRVLKISNIDVDAPRKVVIPQIPTRLEMLSNDKLDMATLPEPLASVAISRGGKMLSSSDELGVNTAYMIFTEDSIVSKKEEIKAFYKAYNQAVEYLNSESLEKYIDILIEEAGFPGVIKDSFSLPKYSRASMPSDKDLEEVLDWLHTKKLTTSDYSLEELSDPSLIQ